VKLALVVHGYPPELVGGTELALQALARGLARRGHEVLVVAGSMDHAAGFRVAESRDRDPVSGAELRVVRIHRADLFFDHWHKSASGRVARAYEALLDEERPDVLHVHHWIRLTDDLVARAAARGVPACVTLHDLWTSCLVAFRVRTGTNSFCEAPLAPDPCIACAAGLPPATPWVDAATQAAWLARRRRVLLRELALARVVVAPTVAHAEALTRFLGGGADDAVPAFAARVRVIPHGRDLALRPHGLHAGPAEHGRLELASWGHLHPLKGQDLLLDALGRLDAPRAVRLHLLGGEPDAEFAARLRADARDLDVVFHGQFDVEQLDEHPGTAVHAMVSGSRAHESWGLVVDEAVALGLPQVLPRAGAFPERVQGGANFYAQGDPDGLARALASLLVPGVWEALRDLVPPLEEVAPTMEAHVEALEQTYADVLRTAALPGRSSQPALEDPDKLEAAVAAWDAALARGPSEP